MRLLLFGFVVLGLIIILLYNCLFVDEAVVEGFKDSNKVIVLLGDSTLKNESYVQSGLSVSEYVNNNNPTTSSS